MSLGSRIKEARLNSGITQEELAKKINVSKGAIGNYEADISRPKEEILISLMDALNVDANFVYQDYIDLPKNYINNISDDVIKKYSSLDQYGKEAVDTLIDVEYKRCTAQIAQDLIDIPFYEFTAASAGYGEYDMNNEYPTVKRVPRTSVTENASYCCYVRGQSMQPMFNDGDLVFVNSKEDAEIGDIGIFAYNGDIYIKQRGEDELISLNKEFPNIKKSPDIICQGKVLGKI